MDRGTPGRGLTMPVLSIISTKGGVGKTTIAANLGGLLAEAGLRVLLLDLDSQPTLSSYYALRVQAPGGICELIASNQLSPDTVVSHTAIAGLDLIRSNDPHGQLSTLLLHAPDGRLRLRHLLPAFGTQYDLVLIDTQGARSVLLEMAILASDLLLSPVLPEMLAARELQRGTLQLLDELRPFRHLGIDPPPLHLLLNRTEAVSSDARLITLGLQQAFGDRTEVRLLKTHIPGLVVYRQAATHGQPAHRLEPRRPAGRKAPAARATLQALALELFPQWRAAILDLARAAGGEP